MQNDIWQVHFFTSFEGSSIITALPTESLKRNRFVPLSPTTAHNDVPPLKTTGGGWDKTPAYLCLYPAVAVHVSEFWEFDEEEGDVFGLDAGERRRLGALIEGAAEDAEKCPMTTDETEVGLEAGGGKDENGSSAGEGKGESDGKCISDSTARDNQIDDNLSRSMPWDDDATDLDANVDSVDFNSPLQLLPTPSSLNRSHPPYTFLPNVDRWRKDVAGSHTMEDTKTNDNDTAERDSNTLDSFFPGLPHETDEAHQGWSGSEVDGFSPEDYINARWSLVLPSVILTRDLSCLIMNETDPVSVFMKEAKRFDAMRVC
ncbi:hypothetical protein HK102_005482 [Quaeritorhiza haematococci]|nr:hypothetical protein HK102_005482 [Quaeritorhiza haematococci]